MTGQYEWSGVLLKLAGGVVDAQLNGRAIASPARFASTAYATLSCWA